MAMEPGLYEAPEGIPLDLAEEPVLELDILASGDGPLVIELDDGGVEISFSEEEGSAEALLNAPFDANLAEYMDENDLSVLSTVLLQEFETDLRSRKDWEDIMLEGMEILGQKYEKRTTPWPDACGVYSSLLSEAAIRFQAEAMSETFPAGGPVETKIIGEETPELTKAARRVKTDMNHLVMDVMEEFRAEHERMLYALGLNGSAFKKVYHDPQHGRPISLYIPAEDVIMPYGSPHINLADRVTHVMKKTPFEVKRLQETGFYREVDLGDAPPVRESEIEEQKAEDAGYTLVEDDRHQLLEMLVNTHIEGLDDEDAAPSPYVITLERHSGTVLGIRRNWRENDPLKLRRQHFVHYTYIHGFGVYGLGLFHIIGGYARAGTSLIRQLIDAGTLSNLPGGFKARDLRVKGDNTPIEPGEFRDVDVPSGTLRDNILPLPYKEPSQTLLALLDRVIEEGRRMGAISDLKISDMSAQAPVGTTLALLERMLKPMAAVQARVHAAFKQELKLLKGVVTENLMDSPAYLYMPEGGEPLSKIEDYSRVEVIPVSDPNSSTLAQRVVQYQAILQLSTQAPQLYDLPYLHRQMVTVLGAKDAERLVPLVDDMQPLDPVSENMNALVGKPMKAFLAQDHQAHLATHTSFMQDPMVAESVGQNPMAQQIMGAMQAHIAEHLGYLYRQQIEERLGVPLPPPNEPLPPEIEVQLSRLVADAGQQLTQIHNQQKAQQEAEQQAQDPVLQLENQKVANQSAEIQRKAAKDAADAKLKAADLQLKAKALDLKSQIDAKKVEATREAARNKTKTELAKTVLGNQQRRR